MACCGNNNSTNVTTSNNSLTVGEIIHGAIGYTKATLGFDQADANIIKTRRDFCRECPEATKDNAPQFKIFKGLVNHSRCKLCKCPIIKKTSLNSEHCPLGKW